MDKHIVLHPGDLAFDRGAQRWETLLGSCVSLTFWHRTQGWAAMCHYILPVRPRGSGKALAPDGRYGDEAVAWIANRMERNRLAPGDFAVGMYGGGSETSSLTGLEIGKRNVEAGADMLRSLGVRRWTQDVLGQGFRKVYFDVATGEVRVGFFQPAARER